MASLTPPDTLARICADKRRHIAQCQAARPLAVVEAAARTADAPRGFANALATKVAAGGYALIAEIKKASPSKGLIRADFDPPTLARAYRSGGAACLSVLTDQPWFQGQDSDLPPARAACDLPVLRKDFMLDPYQIIEARALAADCILLIMAALDDAQALELHTTARQWGMDVLIEVHNETEMERALRLPDGLLGVNNRDLKSLKVDLAVTERLARLVPPGRDLVGESGISNHTDLQRLAAVGVRRFLVGESLMRQADVTQATQALLGTA